MCTVFPTNKQNHPHAIHPKRNRRGDACVPARTSAQRRFHTKNTRIVAGNYPSPSYFSTQSHINKITICTQSPNEINRPYAICPNDTVGAVPVCPPERSRSGVSIPKIGLCITHCAREFNDGCALVGRHGRAHRAALTNLHHIFPHNSTQTK